CDAANLHQRGELTAEQIEYLIGDNPVQRELWGALMTKSASEKKAVSLHSLMAAPRWQWDIRARRLRLYLPRQTVFSLVRPAALAIKKDRYPVQARRDGNLWEIEPTVLSYLPIDWPAPSGFSLELRDEDDHCLRRWPVKPPESSVLFFQLNSAGTLASYANAEKGLPPGEWLIIHHRNHYLHDENGEIHLIRRMQPPAGFEHDYQAVLAQLQPPVTVYDEHEKNDNDSDDSEKNKKIAWLYRFQLLPETPYSLKLMGNHLSEADDPSGTPVYNGDAPELRIPARSFEEVKSLQLQLRELSAAGGAVTELFSTQSLLRSSIAAWSDQDCELRVNLDGILLNRTGRFRVKLLHGLQSARFAPAEFVITPQIRISPSNYEFDQTLFPD
ncbi:MAG: hypothetical protein M3X11_08365, partial [Acidobacteriota bacterium]|nr:hypothetical protein [Acidobacteriota bacterium]